MANEKTPPAPPKKTGARAPRAKTGAAAPAAAGKARVAAQTRAKPATRNKAVVAAGSAAKAAPAAAGDALTATAGAGATGRATATEDRTAGSGPRAEIVVEAAPVLRKKELFERVSKTSGEKKKVVKEIVEATLKVLGEALAAGEELVLPPFGKARVNRQKDLGSAEMLTIRLKRQASWADGTDGADAPKDNAD